MQVQWEEYHRPHLPSIAQSPISPQSQMCLLPSCSSRHAWPLPCSPLLVLTSSTSQAHLSSQLQPPPPLSSRHT